MTDILENVGMKSGLVLEPTFPQKNEMFVFLFYGQYKRGFFRNSFAPKQGLPLLPILIFDFL